MASNVLDTCEKDEGTGTSRGSCGKPEKGTWREPGAFCLSDCTEEVPWSDVVGGQNSNTCGALICKS